MHDYDEIFRKSERALRGMVMENLDSIEVNSNEMAKQKEEEKLKENLKTLALINIAARLSAIEAVLVDDGVKMK